MQFFRVISQVKAIVQSAYFRYGSAVIVLCGICALFSAPDVFSQNRAARKPKTKTSSVKAAPTPPPTVIIPQLSPTPMLKDSLQERFYAKQWKKVDSCLNKNLPKSALEFVEAILAEARKNKASIEITKALLHKAALKAETTDEGETLFHQEMLAAIEASDKANDLVAASLLRSALAEYYAKYLQRNRWRISQRTATQDSETDSRSGDFRTWDVRRFVQTIQQYHFDALYWSEPAKASILKATSVLALETLQNVNYGASFLRPSLYDLLAHNAIEYLQNTANDLPKPEVEFELTDFTALQDPKAFAEATFTTPDANDAKYKTIRLFQELTAMHLADASPEALLDITVIRLKYAKEHIFGEGVEDAYIQALESIAQKHSKHAASAEYLYAIAHVWYERGDYPKALELSRKIFQTDALKESYGAGLAKTLEQQILQKELTIQTEKTIPPNTNILASVHFRNLHTLYFRLIRLDKSQYVGSYFDSNEELTKLRAIKPLAAWKEELPLKDSSGVQDFKAHTVDIRAQIPQDAKGSPLLTFGQYALIASSREDFALQENGFSMSYFTVSSMVILHEHNNKPELGAQRLLVNDAVTGEPLQGITVNLYEKHYNQSKRNYEDVLKATRVTDKNGFCAIESNLFAQSYSSLYPEAVREVGTERDVLRDENSINPARSYTQNTETLTIFYTDRSIYRPGQTIYFKGVVVQVNNEKAENRTVTGYSAKVRFLDVNGQTISEQPFKTNEYGSFHGAFTAPKGALNGRMTISEQYGSIAVQVEEYKRPKFEVKIPPTKGVFRLGENVAVNGNASAYAGSVVDGAEVRYRVVRKARFPYWRDWWGVPPQSDTKEIARGRVKTDAKGEFTINFLAQPDKSVLPSTLPEFSYAVYADVTDISGETRSAETRVTVCYVAVSLWLSVQDRLFTENLSPIQKAGITLTTKNLNGQGLSTQGTITLERLTQPERVMRSRFLPEADRFTMTESEFTSAFSGDIRHNEHRMETWKREQEIYAAPFRSGADGNVNLDEGKGKENFADALAQLKPGAYRMTAEVQDVSGQKLKRICHFTVFDRTSRTVATKAPFKVIPLNTIAEPSDTAQILISTPYPSLRVLYRVEHRGKIIREEWLTISNEQRLVSLPLREDFRGNVAVHFTAVRHSRLYAEMQSISVPWSNKHLTIETSVFRDKMLPGSKEEWRLTIKNAKGEKLNGEQQVAEMLAAMYDASLDAILPHSWQTFSWQTFYVQRSLSSQIFGTAPHNEIYQNWIPQRFDNPKEYDKLYFSIVERALYSFGGYSVRSRAAGKRGAIHDGAMLNAEPMMQMRAENADLSAAPPPPPAPAGMAAGAPLSDSEREDDSFRKGGKPSAKKALTSEQSSVKPNSMDLSGVQARTNLSETAFFFPRVETDADGAFVLKFTMPEALTRWKMLAFAHTPDLKTGSLTKEAITQKELMLLPNMPRFVREGDKITLPVKISNLASKNLAGAAELKLFDASTMEELRLNLTQQPFSVEKGRSTVVSWAITVPDGLQTMLYRVVAKAGDSTSSFSDGEESILPVLPNRMMVTETLPVYIRGGLDGKAATKTFELKKLTESGKSSTLRHHKLTLEMTSNPAWYAIQALPMMMEYPYECAEQAWNRFYANAIASHVANSKPRIKSVFEQWKNSPEGLLSNLEKNQELKSLLLTETPWVMDGKDESERKRRVALLFDLNRMADELESALKKVEQKIGSDGGFSWFPGMPSSRYMTQYIVCGMAHLNKLGITYPAQSTFASRLKSITERAIPFIDREIAVEYEYLKRTPGFKPENQYLSNDAVHYLYTRSFFADKPIPSGTEEAFAFWKKQAEKFWMNQSMMTQAMAALALNRFKSKDVPALIIKSLRERALHSEEMGMYWKQDAGWYWWQAPIETQALLIEAFGEVPQDKQALSDVEDMKVWLLKQKQTTDWKTTKATAEACYALLLQGQDFLASTKLVEVSLGGKPVNPKKMDDVKIEAGTGYYKVSWGRGEITPEMGSVVLKKEDAGIAWGGLYWQYFEKLDKITPAKTPLQIDKKLYRQIPTPKGLELEPISAKTPLKVGDLLIVRVEIRTDRTMEYVHLRDMRGAGLEPVKSLSGYTWKGGLGYYETMKDASANFFIGWLPKGVHVFEYGLRVSHEGEFQNGITTIQSMYAPEFSSHSEGVMVRVGK
ncbi:MAG: MG2 domain-containing protein [Candidatus Kapabacteria bacterium]|jgi:hypothetical protein|nr:MG2 domain-containing protein [Candidatus Kapabacteria bacterium]